MKLFRWEFLLLLIGVFIEIGFLVIFTILWILFFGMFMDMLEDKICKVMKIVKELILMEILIGDDEDFYLGDFIEDINV
ncbi:hypothetical protein GUF71_16300, partial [Xanthomonas citri pv. citri]|nr:hypothetical protein [Xanthomonas citri pv. citri]